MSSSTIRKFQLFVKKIKNIVVYMFWFCFGMISVLTPRLVNVHEFYNFSTIFTNSNTMSSIYPQSPKNLLDIYETYDATDQFDHWKEYAEKYERNLQPILLDLSPEKTFRMLEIGV